MVLSSTTNPYAISDELVQFQANRVKGEGHIVLFVDDDPDCLDILHRKYRKDYTVWVANSAEEALSLLRNTKKIVSAIISDQRMPGMAGTQFFAAIRQQQPTTVRILTSACADMDDMIDAVNHGHIYNFISKPWNFKEMDQTLAQAVALSVLMQRLQITDLRPCPSESH